MHAPAHTLTNARTHARIPKHTQTQTQMRADAHAMHADADACAYARTQTQTQARTDTDARPHSRAHVLATTRQRVTAMQQVPCKLGFSSSPDRISRMSWGCCKGCTDSSGCCCCCWTLLIVLLLLLCVELQQLRSCWDTCVSCAAARAGLLGPPAPADG
ncbi:hypothetical protein COO60DRAFT_151784 [Scenedesmus sp. NREL 46B-D3]|nr:hypothetical protein COO60DRAFT_151784 [Scenedesmus sp. NREL 46B-D3]